MRLRAPAAVFWVRRFSLALGASLIFYAWASLVPSTFLCRFWPCATDARGESAFRDIWHSGRDGLAARTERLRQTVVRDPASAYRWCDLGEALLESGQLQQARQCFLRALDLGPNSPPILLRVSSFYFRAGENDKVLHNMCRILAITPDWDEVIFSYYARMEVAMEEILESGIPQQRRPIQSHLRYLLRFGTLPAVRTAWNWAVSHSLTDDLLAGEYVEFLLNNRQYQMAAEAWFHQVGDRDSGYPHTNRLFNGGFEFEPTGASFDWRTSPIDGVEVRRDRALSHGGSWSLQIRFDGTRNLAYSHVRQRAFVRPGRYRLEAYVRTAGISTDQGIGFRMIDRDSPARLDLRTATLVGTSDWTRLESVFQVNQPTGLVEVQVVRQPSAKFNNRIAGRVWIDDVKLLAVERLGH